jgi:rhodanese-related sulfurtransferase
MRILKLACLLGLFAAFFIYLPSTAGAQEISGYTVITAVDFKNMRDSGKEMLIIDTMGESAYMKGHIPGAKNFEFPNDNMDPWDKSKTAGKSKDDFIAFLGGDKERPLVFYCLDEK